MGQIYKVGISRKLGGEGIHFSLIKFLLDPICRDEFPMYFNLVHSDGKFLTSCDGRRIHRVKISEDNEIPEGVFIPEKTRSSLYLEEYHFSDTNSGGYPKFEGSLLNMDTCIPVPYSFNYIAEIVVAVQMTRIEHFGLDAVKNNPTTLQTRYLKPIAEVERKNWPWKIGINPDDVAGCVVFASKEAYGMVMPLQMVKKVF